MNMNSGIQNLVISLGVMQGNNPYTPHPPPRINIIILLVARKIPFDEPDVLNYVRLGYVVSQVAILAVYYFISFKVRLVSTCFHCCGCVRETTRLMQPLLGLD